MIGDENWEDGVFFSRPFRGRDEKIVRQRSRKAVGARSDVGLSDGTAPSRPIIRLSATSRVEDCWAATPRTADFSGSIRDKRDGRHRSPHFWTLLPFSVTIVQYTSGRLAGGGTCQLSDPS